MDIRTVTQIKEEHRVAVEHLNAAILAIPTDGVLVHAVMSGDVAGALRKFAEKQGRALFHISAARKQVAEAAQTVLLCAALAKQGQREFSKAG